MIANLLSSLFGQFAKCRFAFAGRIIAGVISFAFFFKRLEEEVGDEEAQQTEKSNDGHRDATGVACL